MEIKVKARPYAEGFMMEDRPFVIQIFQLFWLIIQLFVEELLEQLRFVIDLNNFKTMVDLLMHQPRTL